ncbi:hypothetical protein [Streptosporangium sp. KLBMP 9127]
MRRIHRSERALRLADDNGGEASPWISELIQQEGGLDLVDDSGAGPAGEEAVGPSR